MATTSAAWLTQDGRMAAGQQVDDLPPLLLDDLNGALHDLDLARRRRTVVELRQQTAEPVEGGIEAVAALLLPFAVLAATLMGMVKKYGWLHLLVQPDCGALTRTAFWSLFGARDGHCG